jgi:hypothetical protein
VRAGASLPNTRKKDTIAVSHPSDIDAKAVQN